MNLSPVIKVLNHIVSLTEEDKELFGSRLKSVDLKKGEHFLSYGQSANLLGFVEEGLLEMLVSENDDEKMLDFIFANSFATDYACFLQNKAAETRITAIKPTKLLVISKASLEELYDANERFQKIGRLIAEKYYIAFVQRLRSMHLGPKERYNQLKEDYPEMIQQIPQYKIASYLNVSAEWLSKLKR